MTIWRLQPQFRCETNPQLARNLVCPADAQKYAQQIEVQRRLGSLSLDLWRVVVRLSLAGKWHSLWADGLWPLVVSAHVVLV